MEYTTTAIADFLASLPLFSELPSGELSKLTDKIQLLRYRMGQVIVVRDKMPLQVCIIYEGKARLLGYDPRSQMPSTLELLTPGSFLGAINQIRGLACETAIASTEVIALSINNQDFLDLIDKYPQFKRQLKETPSLLEVFDLVGYQLEQQAKGEGNLKNLAQKILPTGEIYYLNPGNIQLKDHPNLLDDEKIWLVSGGSITDTPIGSYLYIEEGRKNLFVNKTVRLVGFPVSAWAELESMATEVVSLEQPISTLAPTTSEPTEMVLEPDPFLEEVEEEEEEIPYAQVELLGKDYQPLSEEEEEEQRRQQKYPYYRGKNSVDGGVACFQMLSKYFGMPFRKEVIQRVINEQIQRTGSLAMPLCGAIVELMGLQGQLVKVPVSAFTRLSPPALIRWQNQLAVLYEVSEKTIVVGVPSKGVLKFKPQEFLDSWEEDGQVLLLKKTKDTPEERFGLSWFIPSLFQYKKVLIEVFIASFFVQLFALANPLMIKLIIDQVITQNSLSTLNIIGLFLLVLAVFESLLTALRTYLFVDTTNRIDMSLGSEIIDHLLRLPLRYFEKRPVGEISTRINELENIRQFLTGTALTVVLDAIFSVIYIIVMLVFSPLLTAVALGIIPVFIVLTLVFSPVIRKQLREKAERNAETQSHLVEVMTGIQTVKAQNIELNSRWEWQERYARYVSAGFKTVITSTIANNTSSFLNKLSALLILWVGVYLVLDGQLTLGSMIAFRIISGYVTTPILRLTQLWQNFQETALSLERLADIVDTPQESEKDRTNIPMPLVQGAIKYENISFRFKPTGPLNLYNVNLEFEPGTFAAIVGSSGAGKSTLTKLISRLYEPEAGRILIDGYDINKVELYSLRRQVGVVPQDTLLFDGTIQENIALTNPDATTEEIIRAAQVAVAHEFIMNLPNGYNTRVGERGASLSGGQRQRIAIARSVLQKPRILVLDEATSALDYATEQQVCLNLSEEFKDTTVFFITHRLGTIKNANVIVMMDQGSVVEQGTHNELMAAKGRYYYLYHQQESKM
jgi:ATP-binding cassette, subfamily B, bacterial HlyB/CyaB